VTQVNQQGWAARKRSMRLPDDRPLAFIDSGGEGPVLLLLHGYSDSSRSFSLLEPCLQGCRLVVPDLPGHGASAAGDGLMVGDFADDIAALLADLGIDRCVVIGHSMGAMVGMVLADRLASTVEALILVSGTLRPAFPLSEPVTKAILRLSDPIDPADPFFDLWHAGPQPVDQTFLDPLRREAAAIPANIWQGILQEFTRLDLTGTARRISVPVLSISGSEDTIFDSAQRTALISALQKPQTVVLKGFGHNPHWEDPAQMALLIDRFLARIQTTLSVCKPDG
jgi:pimeloyl-ACP methyl ester carboxylesterase